MGCDYCTKKNGNQCYCEYMNQYMTVGIGDYDCPNNLYECSYIKAAYIMEEDKEDNTDKRRYINKPKRNDNDIADYEKSGISMGSIISIDSIFSLKTFVCFIVLLILLSFQTMPISMLINGEKLWQTFTNIAFVDGALMYIGMVVYSMYTEESIGCTTCIPWIAVFASIIWKIHLNDIIQKICFVICIIGYLYIVIYGLIPLVFDLMLYLVLIHTSLTQEQLMPTMILAAIPISIVIGIVWVRTAYGRKLWIKKATKKIKTVLKTIYDYFGEEMDEIWSTPVPDMLVQDIARGRDKIKIDPYCKSPIQKRKAMLAVVAIIIFVKILLREEIGLIKMINGIPFLELNDFLHQAVEGSDVTAFWFYTIGSGGLSVLIISLIQTFVVGLEKTKFLSVDGICSWLMNVYIFGLCADVCRPIALICAKDVFSEKANLIIEICGVVVGLSLVCRFSESVKSLLAIYLSRPVFILFTALKLHYIALFVMLKINEIAHIEIFKNTTDILCLLVVLFMELLFEFMEYTGIYERLIKLIKKMTTIKALVITPIIVLPFILFYVFIMKFL